MKYNRYAGLAQVYLAGALLGSTLVAGRFGVGQFDPRTFVSIRLFIIAGIHLLLYLFLREQPFPRDLRLWGRVAVMGLLSTAVPMTGIVSSLQYQSSGVTALLVTLTPVVTVILAHVLLPDEQLNGRKIFGALLAFGGAGFLLLQGETGLSSLARADWRGYAWVGIAVLSASSGIIYARRVLNHENTFDVATIRMVTAAAMLIPVVLLTSGYDVSQVDGQGYLALVYAALGAFVAFLLQFRIIKHHGASIASQIDYITPVVAAGLGSLILDEQITLIMLGGIGLIFMGLWLLNRRPPEAPTKPAPPVATSSSSTDKHNF